MNRLLYLPVVALAALALAGCGQAPDHSGKLPDFGTDKPDSARQLDQRVRGRLDLPVLSGIFTLRPDRSVLEVQRLQVSGSRDSISLSCSTDVGSSSWWSSRPDTSKQAWQMSLREGRGLDSALAERLVASPGCMVQGSSGLLDQIYMPLTPVETQPLVYKGASGKVSYTLTLPASADIAGAHVQTTAKGAGKLTCQQVIGDVSGGAIMGGAEPAVPKLPTEAARRAWIAAHPRPQGTLLGVAGSPGDGIEINPSPGRDKTMIVHGIVGQSTSREVARLGGLWCARYQGGRGYHARFSQIVQMHRVNVPIAAQIAPSQQATAAAAALSATGALGVSILSEASVIAKVYPKLQPQPSDVVITDDTRTQALSAQLLLYPDQAQARSALVQLRKDKGRTGALSLACSTIIESAPASEAQAARANAQLQQLTTQLTADCAAATS